jgi:hypothetical protein
MRSRFWFGGLTWPTALLCVAILATPADAAVTVRIDRQTLDEVLPAVTQQAVEVPLAEGNKLTVQIVEMKVTGLATGTDDNPDGSILTSLKLKVPELGLTLPVEPRIALRAVSVDGASVLELSFVEVPLRLPLAGAIDVAKALPPLRYPAENLYTLEGATGEVPVRTKLRRVRTERDAVEFVFDVVVAQQP